MRDIKFRGKGKNSGEWFYGYYWCNLEAGDFRKGRHFIRSMNFQPAKFDYTDYEVIPETVGQFTGLLDKNGKEIYRMVARMNPNKECRWLEIIWAECGFYYKCSCGRIFSRPMKNNDEPEVIGNVHDNPELLGGPK